MNSSLRKRSHKLMNKLENHINLDNIETAYLHFMFIILIPIIMNLDNLPMLDNVVFYNHIFK